MFSLLKYKKGVMATPFLGIDGGHNVFDFSMTMQVVSHNKMLNTP